MYEELIYRIKDVAYGSNELIYAEKESNNNDLYFLLKGSVMLKYPTSKDYKKVLHNLSEKKDKEKDSDKEKKKDGD